MRTFQLRAIIHGKHTTRGMGLGRQHLLSTHENHALPGKEPLRLLGEALIHGWQNTFL